MTSIELTPDVLRALAEGIDRLQDSDPKDRERARTVEKALAEAGYTVVSGACYPASETTSGYVRPDVWAYLQADGEWSVPVLPGDTLYLDTECTIPLRVL